MQVVGTGLRGHDGGTVSRAWILGAVVRGEHLNFLDGVNAGINDQRAVVLIDAHVQRFRAIHREAVVFGAPAIDAVRDASGLSYLGLVYARSEEHTSELQSLRHLLCRLLL